MGVCHSDQQKAPEEIALIGSKKSLKTMKSFKKADSIKEIKFRLSDFVSQNNENLYKVYKVLSPPLGKGAYGEVRKALHLQTQEYRAIKIITLDEWALSAKKRIINEINILKSLDHPHIVTIHEFFDNGNRIYIIMEYLEGEPILEYLIKNSPTITERKIAELMHQLLSAIHFMHINGIVHRDIKSENILYNGKVLTVIDFGASKSMMENKMLRSVCGTLFYMAPEVMQGNYDAKCDIWSAGILFYILLSGQLPYDASDKDEIIRKIKNYDFAIPFENIKGISPEARDLLMQMLQFNSVNRINAERALQHKFFDSLDRSVDNTTISGVLNNLEHLIFKSKLQEAVYMYFLNSIVTQSEQYEIIRTFKAMDENNDGLLTLKELTNGLKLTGRIVSDEEIQDLFNKIDQDKNGTISFSEYLAGAIDREKLFSEERIIKVFKIFDKVV